MRIESDQLKTLGVIAVMIAVFVGVVWYPAHREREALKARVTQARETLGIDITGKQKSLAEWHTLVSNLRQEVAKDARQVPERNELSHVLTGLNSALRDHGITDQQFNTRSQQHTPRYSIVPVSVEFRTDGLTAYDALRSIESMPRLVRVERLALESSTGDPGQPLTVELDLSTFYAADDAAQGGE